jgi:hypothetical protein
MTISKGTFQVQVTPEAPFDVVEEGGGSVSIGRVTVQKQLQGALEATSVVHMIGVRTPIDGMGGYVAIERVTGVLEGKRGTFVLQHSGTMTGGKPTLDVTVVPGSGTGELRGLRGVFVITIEAGKHFYAFDWSIDA